jgi:hypothetical protein
MQEEEMTQKEVERNEQLTTNERNKKIDIEKKNKRPKKASTEWFVLGINSIIGDIILSPPNSFLS